MHRARLAILGSGALPRAVCYSLATLAKRPLTVSVLARSGASAAEVCHVARVRAAVSQTPVSFASVTVDLGDVDALSAALAAIGPEVVTLCASTQSPWERYTAPSAWTRLIKEAGFGVTLPFHLTLARVAGLAVAASCPGAVYLNAAFPDLVNPALGELGIRVTAGVGNIAILAASLQSTLQLPDQSALTMLAHHLHLYPPASDVDEAVAWLHGEPIACTDGLAQQRRTDRRETNQITGHTVAALLVRLAAGESLKTHLPGPLGLPGGYPVTISASGVQLRLPDAVNLQDAVRENQRWSELDGVTVSGGHVRLSPSTAERLRTLDRSVPDQFPLTQLDEAMTSFSELRSRLRASND